MQRDELKEKPFCLKDGQIDWVENTLKAMSLDEKLGQMICPGEFFCLDDLLKGLAGVCRPGQNDPAWMPEPCWKIWQRCKERRKNEILFVGKSKYNTGKISEEQKEKIKYGKSSRTVTHRTSHQPYAPIFLAAWGR